MKIYLYLLFFFLCCVEAKAQDAPVKWATQETFFEDLQGKVLPDFKGLTTNKRPFTKSDLKNQIVLINFWFEKCPPCLAEMPELNALVEKHKAQGVRFIGITHDKPNPARKFQIKHPYNYEVVSLTPDEIRKLNINHGFPSNILIGKDGRILYAMANISFSEAHPEFNQKSTLLEEKLKAEIEKSKKDANPN